MIWLKKARNARLYDGKLNVAVFLQQMMEIYVDCKICSIWVTFDEKQKAKLFNSFAKDKKLSSYINFGFEYFSKAEYQLYPELLKQNLATTYSEYLQDLTNAFSLCVKKIRFFYDPEPGFKKADVLDSQLSFYLFQGMWTAIRLFLSGPCRYETVIQNGVLNQNYDFLNDQLYSFNEELVRSPIINTVEFYQKCAEEAILDFIQLGVYIYRDSAKAQMNINVLNRKVDDLAKETKQNKEDIFNLTDTFEEFKKQVSKKDEGLNLDEMMAALKENKKYIIVVKSVPEFDQYCVFLLQNKWQFYNGDYLCKSEKWHKYFYANFLNDTLFIF